MSWCPGRARRNTRWVPEILQVELPVEPEGECDPEVEDRVANFMRKNEQLGQSLTQEPGNLKSFRNPNIFTKLIEVFSIREYGTKFPPESNVDLYSLPKESFYCSSGKPRRRGTSSGRGTAQSGLKSALLAPRQTSSSSLLPPPQWQIPGVPTTGHLRSPGCSRAG